MATRSRTGDLISDCQNIIKSFNPVTHSIDTHLLEVLGNVTNTSSNPDDVFLQQAVYGCYKENALLQKFLDDFYSDNSSRVLRVDALLYKVLAYISIFRMEELGISKFREITSSVESSKLSTLIEYIFNEENLWNLHRSSWMEIKDLSYIETKVIPTLLKFVPEMRHLNSDLSQTGPLFSQKTEAKKDLEMKGKNFASKKITTPISPKLSKPNPTILPQPIKIEQSIKASKVPSIIYKTSLQEIHEMKSKEKDKIRGLTIAKYNAPDNNFNFTLTKSGKSIEQIREEIERKKIVELQFNNSYHNPPPKIKPTDMELINSIKPNAAAILREDSLYRKQQAKDAEVLKNYEEELRDPIEYYYWQETMEKQDEIEKLKYVSLRREQAKQSSEEAKLALINQKADNSSIASMIREQNEIIKRQKRIEQEIEILKKQAVVRELIQDRETKPYEAVSKVIETKQQQALILRHQLEKVREEKLKEDGVTEIVNADRIRQLKALNTIHRKHVVVFDPTETSKIGLLDEMSYLEMKERLRLRREKEEELTRLKNEEINLTKDSRSQKLASRYESILKNRQLKKASLKEMRMAKLQLEAKEKEEKECYVKEQSSIWEVELQRRNDLKEREKQALFQEQEKVIRQQQYLGVAQQQVALLRDKEITLAKYRQLRQLEEEANLKDFSDSVIAKKEANNKSTFYRRTTMENEIQQKEIERQVEFEKKQLIKKMKDSVVYKKQMFQDGQKQHSVTRTVLYETNPYASEISNNVRAEASMKLKKL